MGKNYFKELARLAETYDWARQRRLDALMPALSRCQDLALVAVGSGGSYSCAAFAALLHEEYSGSPAKHVTPLELTQSARLSRRAVLLISARGNNPDIVDAIDFVGRQEPPVACLLVLNKDSKAARAAEGYPSIHVMSLDPPVRRDGYLATNSMIATVVLLIRSYEQLWGAQDDPPSALPQARLEPVVHRDTSHTTLPRMHDKILSILYGGWAMPSAIDLESKLTESAIQYAQLSDFRNFAHGRHYWIAQRPNDTALLALTTPGTAKLAQRTVALLPQSVTAHYLTASREGAWGGLELLVGSMDFLAHLALSEGIDPGRPSVPLFGRRIYRLASSSTRKRPTLDLAVERKLGDQVRQTSPRAFRDAQSKLQSFLHDLIAAKFDSIVFDYDGTLCAEEFRRRPLPREVTSPLASLLRKGVRVGIATGRGRSVRDAMQKSVAKALWPLITIGYYNGAEVGGLQDPPPDRDAEPIPALRAIASLVAADPVVAAACDMEIRPKQVTLTPKFASTLRATHRLILELARRTGLDSQLSILRSSTSVDVIPIDVSKIAVVDFIQAARDGGSNMSTLCIADGGSWDGNDLSLLSTPYSLTVHESPRTSGTGWNLTPPGCQGVPGTLHYLSALVPEAEMFRLDVDRLLEWSHA